MDKKEPDDIFLAIKSGVSACLTKDTEPEHLLDVIRVIAQGSIPIMEELFDPAVASLIIAEFEDIAVLNEQFDDLLANLTPRELQILNSISAGDNIEQATVKLGISEEVIRRNTRLILNKLVANDQARTIIEAAQRSLPGIIRSGNYKNIDYITKAEFNEFKDRLMERLKSLID
jgi:DNA-binding NarL/FixJ family response regulator